MNTNFTLKITALCFLSLAIVSCESHEQKADEAFERVKEDKLATKDDDTGTIIPVETVATETTVELAKPEIVIKTINTDEWSKFKLELDKKILAGETKIKAIKATPNANSDLISDLTGLEKDFNDLRSKMDEYNEEMKVELGKFRVKMNHEVNVIAIELNDKVNKNKK